MVNLHRCWRLQLTAQWWGVSATQPQSVNTSQCLALSAWLEGSWSQLEHLYPTLPLGKSWAWHLEWVVLLPGFSSALSPALSTLQSYWEISWMEGCAHATVTASGSRSLCCYLGQTLQGVYLPLLAYPVHLANPPCLTSAMLLVPSPEWKFFSTHPSPGKGTRRPTGLSWSDQGRQCQQLSHCQLSWSSCYPNSQGQATLSSRPKSQAWNLATFLKIEVIETPPSRDINSLWRWRHQQPSHLQQDLSKSSINGGRQGKLSSGLGTKIQNIPQSLVLTLV